MSLGMLRLFKLITLFLLSINLNAATKSLDFEIVKKGIQNDNTLLIIGGIQGDEPGGFMAASLIATHYNILEGSVWVVPNLNFYSIIKRSRAPYGDMNRKFANISKKDPDYISVQRIKELIKAPQVKMVLNLHDGSGYYRKKYIDNMHSPYRWGQSAIIDQAQVNVEKYGNLEHISQQVCDYVNQYLIRKEDSYLVHNTKTREGDKEMEKTLTYYAINNGKAAFGNEASKSLPVHERVYYHLLALEKYMQVMGVKFERKFKMKPQYVRRAIDKDIYISFYDEKIKLPLSQIRKYLNYFPVNKNGEIDFKPSTPVMTIVKNKSSYAIHYGNRRLAILKPDYQDIYNKNEMIPFKIDGKKQDIKIGSLIHVQKNFLVDAKNKYRVNVIGYTNKKRKNEAGLTIRKNQILKRFSIDKKGQIYRVEFYKKDKFAGMVLVKFKKKELTKTALVQDKKSKVEL
jgi:hypothetical protein